MILLRIERKKLIFHHCRQGSNRNQRMPQGSTGSKVHLSCNVIYLVLTAHTQWIFSLCNLVQIFKQTITHIFA